MAVLVHVGQRGLEVGAVYVEESAARRGLRHGPRGSSPGGDPRGTKDPPAKRYSTGVVADGMPEEVRLA